MKPTTPFRLVKGFGHAVARQDVVPLRQDIAPVI
jgi:hypothetical protein